MAAAEETIKVKGLREFGRAVKKADKQTKDLVREKLKEAAEPVLQEARKRFERYDVQSASGFRVRVWGRGYGVYVEQSKRRKTGLRPDYGRLQMQRALEPSLADQAQEVERTLERVLDELADKIGR